MTKKNNLKEIIVWGFVMILFGIFVLIFVNTTKNSVNWTPKEKIHTNKKDKECKHIFFNIYCSVCREYHRKYGFE